MQSPQTNINTSSKHRATQTTSKKPSHSASSSESAAYVLPTLSLTNEAENLSSTLPNVVIAAPHYKEMRIAFAQFHVTQPFNRKNRNPPRLTGHPLSHPSTLRFLKYHLSSTSIPLSLKQLPTAKKPFPNPPVIAYRRNASVGDLLVHSTLSHENSSSQQPAGIKKCNHPRFLTCSFLQEGQTNYPFITTSEARKTRHRLHVSCKKGSGGSFNKQSQNSTSVWHKQKRWSTPVTCLTLIYS